MKQTAYTHIAILTTLTILTTLLAACGGDALGERMITVPLAHEDGTNAYENDANYDPNAATGTASIDTVTGTVTVMVTGVPMLEATDIYEVWLAGGGEDATSAGLFNTDANGAGMVSATLGNISERTFERVVLTVEPVPDPSTAPDSRHSIGGNIPTK